jgi:hypothetical protein
MIDRIGVPSLKMHTGITKIRQRMQIVWMLAGIVGPVRSGDE